MKNNLTPINMEVNIPIYKIISPIKQNQIIKINNNLITNINPIKNPNL
jgi:hypothetical protein